MPITDFYRIAEDLRARLGKTIDLFDIQSHFDTKQTWMCNLVVCPFQCCWSTLNLIIYMWLCITACDSGNSAATVVAYGHLGDGNVHLNVSAPKYDDEVLIENPPSQMYSHTLALIMINSVGRCIV